MVINTTRLSLPILTYRLFVSSLFVYNFGCLLSLLSKLALFKQDVVKS